MTDIEDKGWVALEFLRKTDDQHAALDRDAKLAEHKYKKTVDIHFLVLEGSIEQRKAEARKKADDLYIEFLRLQAEADELGNKRRTAQTAIDYCRTIMANRRMG